ncbi:RNA polymerase subunit sigma [Bordetella genomosp. 10]|uniref:RNA polymerase subunit sigma n=1 Tax=Bordetella genomosp. 10 TaxID=1416804 RepID=A0A261S0R1_9BORD|nr:sigma-70 family RNA polymerase sigma factor [Bordetella genomosp. 10]OZI30939.1 RNA polymerase subunit sigma [Bordetella genomosp. 10]
MQTLYIEHHRWLESWLRRQIGCLHQAADLAHDTFEQVLRAAEPPALREPRAYLAVIAKRVLFNHWRRRDLEQAYLEALAAFRADDFAPSAEDCAAVLEALARIDALLEGLGPRVRQVFLLNQLEDKTYREIGQELGMPVISVRRAMAKAIAACCAQQAA